MTPFLYHCTTCGKTYPGTKFATSAPPAPRITVPASHWSAFYPSSLTTPRSESASESRNRTGICSQRSSRSIILLTRLATRPSSRLRRWARQLGFDNVWLKNDGLNPSASLKDRASFLVVAEANRLKEPDIVTASTGNAASALAAVCASAGKQAIILVPESAPKAKLVQMVLYGARVIPVRGTYDDAFRLSLEYTARKGGLNRNTAYHPLTIEGKKTVGLEIYEQNKLKVPDVILVPVGDGVIISGVFKAFYDLKAAGLIARLPRLVCVQAERSAAIHHYLRTGKYRDARHPVTVADSISVSIPSNAHMAREAVLQSRGFSITVTDREILRGQQTLAEQTGIFAEPAAAATVAALKKLQGSELLDRKEQIVLLITGHGLKDVEAAMKSIRIPPSIDPEVEAL